MALIAFLAYSIPHFAYHLTTTDHYSTGDNLGSLGGFVVDDGDCAVGRSWRPDASSADAKSSESAAARRVVSFPRLLAPDDVAGVVLRGGDHLAVDDRCAT